MAVCGWLGFCSARALDWSPDSSVDLPSLTPPPFTSPLPLTDPLTQLAPDCAGVDASSSQCRQDGEGLRLTFFLVTLWLAWTVVFFGLALLLAGRTLRRNKRQVNSFGFGGGDSRLLLLGGPGEGNDDDDEDEGGGGMGGDEDFVDVLSEPLLPHAGRGPGGEGDEDGEAAGRSSTYIL